MNRLPRTVLLLLVAGAMDAPAVARAHAKGRAGLAVLVSAAAVLLALSGATILAQPRPDLSGSWRPVRLEGAGLTQAVTTIEQDVRLNVDATTLTVFHPPDGSSRTVYKLDGSETRTADETAHASWVGNTIVVDSVMGDLKIKMKTVYSLDATGSLVIEAAAGPPIGDGTPVRTICKRVSSQGAPATAAPGRGAAPASMPAAASTAGDSRLPPGFTPPTGFVLDEKNSKVYDFGHEPMSYPKQGAAGNDNIEPEGRMWSLFLNLSTPNKTGEATDATMRAALKAQGWELYTASGTLIAHRLNGSKVVWFKGAAFAADYRATVIEAGPPPHALVLPAPGAAIETFGDAADFPYLLKFPGSTLKRTQVHPNDTVDATMPGGPGEQLVGSSTIEKDYDVPASVSTYEFMVVYRDALTKAGWTVIRAASGSDALVVAHYAKNGRDIYAYLHGGVFKVADIGAANEAKKLADALARDGHVAIYGIYFDVDKSTLKPESETALQHVLELLKASPTLALEVQGHTDNTGNAPHNQTLSEARAASVKSWLVDHGVAAARLTPKGYGDTQPVGDNKTPEGRAKNRRVELKK